MNKKSFIVVSLILLNSYLVFYCDAQTKYDFLKDEGRISIQIDTSKKSKSPIITYNSKPTKIIPKEKEKNPYMALGFALFPGCFIHGLGHFYAGEIDKGIILTIISGLSIIGVKTAVGSSLGGATDADILGVVSFVVFFSTWAYDLIGAPFACKRYNELLRGKASLYPYIKNDEFGNQVGFKVSHRF